MQAYEIMSTDAATVGPNDPIDKIARLMLDRGVSAVPVVDAFGAPIGMVSEGDLVGRSDTEPEARRDWWLTLLAEGEALNPDFLAGLRQPRRMARDVMSAPVVTIDEDTEAPEIARLLTDYRIKRVPVLRDGRLVGIVSRVDLVRTLAAERLSTAEPAHGGLLSAALIGLDRPFRARRQPAGAPAIAAPQAVSAETRLNAEAFRHLVADFERLKARHHDDTLRAAAEQWRRRVRDLIDQHVAEGDWQTLMHRAREAAEHGEKEFLLLRFPSELCSDGGRAINTPLPDWPATLRGEPAELYLRWERDLKPLGFHLTARVLDFPAGFPGDIGLFLVWLFLT